MQYHIPVLLAEVLEYLKVEKDNKYIDCTLGDGGHTLEILKRGGKILGIDADEGSLTRSQERINELGLSACFTGVCGNFRSLTKIANDTGYVGVAGIL